MDNSIVDVSTWVTYHPLDTHLSPGTGPGILDLLGYPMGQATQPWAPASDAVP